MITLTATKGSDLIGLKHSMLTLVFVVDGEEITKQFNWAKVMKGADGKDGVDGEDGKSPNLYVRYATERYPTSLSQTVTVETSGYKYQGICWSTSDTAPTKLSDYEPFVLYDPADGVVGANGYVHIAYSSSDDGSTDFTTGIPSDIHTYMGVCTDHEQDDPDYENRNKYKWARFRGEDGLDGEDGISITLGNEAQLIPCNSDGKVSDTLVFTIPFYCYKGTTLYPCNYSVGNPNPWTQQGFTYTLNNQCTSTSNGLITITAPKGSTLNDVKQSIITLDFLVDTETVSKEFSWSKVIKGTDGVDGEDGLGITLGNDVQSILCDNTGKVLDEITFTIPFFCWKGGALYKCDYQVGSPNPWTQQGFTYTLNNQCSTTTNGKITLTAPKGSTLGGIKQNTVTMNFLVDEEIISREFTWTKVLQGIDGATPTPSVIEEVVSKTEVNASTLDGKTADSFIPSQIPTTIVARDDSDTSQNCVKIYEVGQLVICQVWKFNADKGTHNYGQDPDSSSYFLLMNKQIPQRLWPKEPIYINDLNDANGNANGRLRLSSNGRVTKLGTAGSAYNNTYGTFIYPVIPKQNTTVSMGTVSSSMYGARVSADVSSNNTGVANISVLFTFTPTDTSYPTITKIEKTTDTGYVSTSMLLEPGVGYNVKAKCVGNGSYYESEEADLGSIVTLTETIPQIITGASGKTITVHVKNSNKEVLPNVRVYLGVYQNKYTDNNGAVSFTVSSAGTYTINIFKVLNKGLSADASASVTIY